MKALIQRSTQGGKVEIEGKINGQISKGLTVLLGITHTDTEADVEYIAEKISNMRLFPSEKNEFDLSILDIQGQILLISQFTLYAQTEKGRRPDFALAAKPEIAQNLYEKCIEKLRSRGITVETGVFGADMQVSLTNNGPVTIILESKTAKQ